MWTNDIVSRRGSTAAVSVAATRVRIASSLKVPAARHSGRSPGPKPARRRAVTDQERDGLALDDEDLRALLRTHRVADVDEAGVEVVRAVVVRTHEAEVVPEV